MTVVPFQPVSQVSPIPGIINANSLSLLSGAPGSGKTALVTGIMSCVRDGRNAFGHPTNTPPAIGYIGCDRGWEGGAAHWFERAGLNEGPTLRTYSLADDITFLPSKLRNKNKLVSELLRMCLEKLGLPSGAMVIIDPIALFIGNLNDYAAVAASMMEIRALLRAHKLCALGLCHTGKQKNDKRQQYTRAQDSINGSTALHGFSDAQLHLSMPNKQGKPYLFLIHPHNAPAELHRLDRDEQGRFLLWDPLRLPTNAMLYEAIPTDGTVVPLTRLIELCVPTLSTATVFRKLIELTAEGLIEKVAEGRYRRAQATETAH